MASRNELSPKTPLRQDRVESIHTHLYSFLGRGHLSSLRFCRTLEAPGECRKARCRTPPSSMFFPTGSFTHTMTVTSTHTADSFRSVLANERNHGVVVDLPTDKGGDDLGATALELTAMSLAGCISTIWAKVATNSRVDYRSVDVEVTLDQANGASTFTDAHAIVRVDSDADRSKLERVLSKTMNACPVGLLFERADVSIGTDLVTEPALEAA